MSDKTWIIIPAYNEAKRIGPVLAETKQYAHNVIVVDDGSRDNTYAVAQEHTSHVLRHIVNLGKGNAVKTGIEYALLQGADNIVLMDSDGQHEPKDIPRFINGLSEHDIVFGYRVIDNTMPAIFRFGNNAINFITRILYGIKLKDTQCGFRSFRAQLYPKIRWTSEGYSVESEIIARTGKHKLTYTEIPIKTIYEDRHKGTTVLDGLKIGLQLLFWKVRL